MRRAHSILLCLLLMFTVFILITYSVKVLGYEPVVNTTQHIIKDSTAQYLYDDSYLDFISSELLKAKTQFSSSKYAIVTMTHPGKPDLSWLNDKVFAGVQKIIIDKGDKQKFPHGARKGLECDAYLNFILKQYESLPEYIAFVHDKPHESSKVLVDSLRKGFDFLSLDSKRKYLFKCIAFPGLPFQNLTYKRGVVYRPEGKGKWGGGAYIRWIPFETVKNVFEVKIKNDYVDIAPMPACIGVSCCANFIVSRNQILKRSRGFYEALYNATVMDRNDKFNYCAALENYWHIIFKQVPIMRSEIPPVAEEFFGTENFRWLLENLELKYSQRCTNLECKQTEKVSSLYW